MKKYKQEQVALNPSLLNIITPMGLEFKPRELDIGEYIGKIYGINKYPVQVKYGWLANVSNIPSTIISQTFTPFDSTALVEAVSKNIRQNKDIYETTNDPATQKRAQRGIEDGESILDRIQDEGESVGFMTNLVMPLENDEKRFKTLCKRVEAAYSTIRCKIRPLPFLQKEAFQTLSPYHVPNPSIEDVSKNLVPLSTFIGGFGFSSSSFNDGTGSWFANTKQGRMIVLDIWKRGGDRGNSNIVITGDPGVGKSTVIKNIIVDEMAKGTLVIMADPQGEYKDLTLNLEGDWINCAGGSKGMINPLHIKTTPPDDPTDNEKLYVDTGNGIGDLALHMKTLEIFFSLYIPSLTDIQNALLKDCLIELYKDFNIVWDTDITKLTADDFPIFEDLYNTIEARAQGKKHQKEYEILSALFKDIACGSDSFLWNGKTTIDPKSQLICLDITGIQNTSERVKSAQYFNMLTLVWDIMTRDRCEKVMFVGDEIYLMLDPKVPQSAVFLRNFAKQARKFDASVAIISQSIRDFLDDAIRIYGQALLSMPAYKVFMGCDGIDLKEIAELYNLTDSEYDLLKSKKRGHALLTIGSRRMHVSFMGMIPDYKMKLFGDKGGR